jgi:hypothetical protein
MSAMGERFLLLEDTADALDVIDPELARQFRLVNGLPYPGLGGVPLPERLDPSWRMGAGHAASIDESPDGIRVDCSCGGWHASVGWDEIDDLVVAARAHFGMEGGPILNADAGRSDETGAAGPPPIRRWVS